MEQNQLQYFPIYSIILSSYHMNCEYLHFFYKSFIIVVIILNPNFSLIIWDAQKMLVYFFMQIILLDLSIVIFSIWQCNGFE